MTAKLVRPRALRVEASSLCQLRCPSCPRATGHTHRVIGHGSLALSAFQKLLDGHPWINRIELSNYGEMFLNPDLLGIMEYAAQRRVSLSADNGVNLNYAPEEVLAGLVKYGFRNLTVALDGASPDTYARYRVGGSFADVRRNIEKINYYKKLYRSPFPVLQWQFIPFGHNEQEIPAARALARTLGMSFSVKLSWDDDFSRLQDPGRLRAELGVASRHEFREKYGMDYRRGICTMLWLEPQINWDGKILGCSRNFWGEFPGNAFQDGLVASLNSPALNTARDMLLGRAKPQPGIPCTTCDLFADLAANSWLTPLDIRRAALRHTIRGVSRRYSTVYRLLTFLRRWPSHFSQKSA